MQTHTPGPWTLTERGDLIRIREEASDAVIATTDNGGHPTDEIFDYETQLANARLIASAPELLRNVQQCVDAFEAIKEYIDCGDLQLAWEAADRALVDLQVVPVEAA